MANPFSKGWKYLQASLDHTIDQNADPQIQIRQAVEGAKKQHQQISQQAAAVIGNKNQLEMKLNRLIEEQQKLADKTRQALTLADQANAQGDAVKSQEFSSTAEIYATQLVSVETQLEETKTLHAQAAQNAEQAKRHVQQSEARLKQQLAEADQLLSQARQAQMQESATKAMDTMNQIKPDDSVPTLDHVRAKIESRYANAMGAQELLENSVGDRLAEIEAASNDMKASAKLAEIRAQMHGGDSATGGQLPAGFDSTSPQLPAGTGVDAGTTATSGFGDGESTPPSAPTSSTPAAPAPSTPTTPPASPTGPTGTTGHIGSGVPTTPTTPAASVAPTTPTTPAAPATPATPEATTPVDAEPVFQEVGPDQNPFKPAGSSGTTSVVNTLDVDDADVVDGPADEPASTTPGVAVGTNKTTGTTSAVDAAGSNNPGTKGSDAANTTNTAGKNFQIPGPQHKEL